VVFGLATSALLYGLQERVLAPARREADRLERIIRKWPALISPLDRRWAVGADGSLYHYDFFDPNGNRFSRLHVYRLDEESWTLRGITFARDATPSRKDEIDEGGPIQWTGRQGWERSFASEAVGTKSAMTYTSFGEKEFRLEPPKYFRSEIPDADMMTYGQLKDFIERLQASGADAARYVVALQRKVAFPLMTVIMTLLAVPFAVTTGRRGALYGIGAALVIAMTYRIAESVFGAFGAGGLLPPVLAAWAPNLLFGMAAGYLLLTVRT
jgi:lipopolysaccharide export LptBFGC system permease protein LptF